MAKNLRRETELQISNRKSLNYRDRSFDDFTGLFLGEVSDGRSGCSDGGFDDFSGSKLCCFPRVFRGFPDYEYSCFRGLIQNDSSSRMLFCFLGIRRYGKNEHEANEQQYFDFLLHG